MKPQHYYDLAARAFHEGEFAFYTVDSVPFADDMPSGIGVRFEGDDSAYIPGAIFNTKNQVPGHLLIITKDVPPIFRSTALQSLRWCLEGAM